MNTINQQDYNLVYCNAFCILEKTYNQIFLFDKDKLTKKDLQKLITHFFITKILKYKKETLFKEKLVFFIFKKDLLNISDKDFIKSFFKSLKQISKLVPFPLNIIEDDKIFIKNNGHLKELNNINFNYYINRKHSIRQLTKFLKENDFFELIEVFSCIKNINTLSN